LKIQKDKLILELIPIKKKKKKKKEKKKKGKCMHTNLGTNKVTCYADCYKFQHFGKRSA